MRNGISRVIEDLDFSGEEKGRSKEGTSGQKLDKDGIFKDGLL